MAAMRLIGSVKEAAPASMSASGAESGATHIDGGSGSVTNGNRTDELTQLPPGIAARCCVTNADTLVLGLNKLGTHNIVFSERPNMHA